MKNPLALAPRAAARLAALLAALLLAPALAAAEGNLTLRTTAQPVVLELYTSQGCSSCPPADALLGELAKRDNLLPLAFHVDYWDYIGWEDPYADPAYGERQRAYREAFANSYVYTPQIVVDGRAETVGSQRDAVEQLIGMARPIVKLPIGVVQDENGALWADLPAGTAPEGGSATLWLALYDDAIETEVQAGENDGRRLTDYNIVRQWVKVGSWDGNAQRVSLAAIDAAAHDGCALILQQGEVGPVLGAVAFAVE